MYTQNLSMHDKSQKPSGDIRIIWPNPLRPPPWFSLWKNSTPKHSRAVRTKRKALKSFTTSPSPVVFVSCFTREVFDSAWISKNETRNCNGVIFFNLFCMYTPFPAFRGCVFFWYQNRIIVVVCVWHKGSSESNSSGDAMQPIKASCPVYPMDQGVF